GKLVRRYSSKDTPEPVNERDLNVPTYWVRPARVLSAAAGSHRFVWDLHRTPPEGGRRSYPIAAVYRDTPSEPRGRGVLPGRYVVRLTAGGKNQEQPLEVKMDPRVKTPPQDLVRQFELSARCSEAITRAHRILGEVRQLRDQVSERRAEV